MELQQYEQVQVQETTIMVVDGNSGGQSTKQTPRTNQIVANQKHELKQQQQEQQQHQLQRPQKFNKPSKQQFLHSMPINNSNYSNRKITAKVGVGGSDSGMCASASTPTGRTHTAQKLYAKALYDNVADSPDELAFRKGDILAVIEQDTDGLVGWWLCTLRGRQGLCPGNRLRILNSYDSGCFSPSPASSPCPSLAASTATLNSSICSADIYENSSIISSSGSSANGSGNGCISASQTQLNTTTAGNAVTANNLHQHQQQQQQQQQRQGIRRSWHVSPNKVITPQRHGDVYVYHTAAPIITHPTTNTNTITATNLLESYPSHQQIYQNLPTTKFINHEFENYDIPKPAIPVNYDLPKHLNRTIMAHLTTSTPTSTTAAAVNTMMKTCATVIQEENYDIPRPLAGSILQHQHTLTPSSSNSSLLTSDSLSLSFSSSNRSSLANMPDYDIPRRNPLPVRTVLQQQQQQQQQQQLQQQQQMQHQSQQRPNSRTSMNGNCLSYDFPLPISNTSLEKTGTQALLITKELPLELSSALETLAKLQSETTTAITRLLSFVSPDWRTHDKLEPVLMEVKLAVVRLRTALHDLTEFGEGALGNAARSEDRTLAQKLRPIIRALRDANKLVQDSCESLETKGGWLLENLTWNEDKNGCKPPDSLDQLVACAQTLTEDVRSTTSFIQGNASLLFKRHLPELAEEGPLQNANENGEEQNTTEWLEDYDYVSFESKDAAAKKNSALREAIPENLKNKFDNVLKAAENTVITVSNTLPTTPNGKKSCSELTDKDKMLVRYYAVQISTHMGNLRQAIDSFLETVEKNQPPKFFIAYGKFVVVSAHNLVTIGDIVHRNVSKTGLKEKILRCTDALSEALKICVLKSKQAAAHFPSVTAVQEMVDSVVDISHLASDLKTVMLHAVQLTI